MGLGLARTTHRSSATSSPAFRWRSSSAPATSLQWLLFFSAAAFLGKVPLGAIRSARSPIHFPAQSNRLNVVVVVFFLFFWFVCVYLWICLDLVAIWVIVECCIRFWMICWFGFTIDVGEGRSEGSHAQGLLWRGDRWEASWYQSVDCSLSIC